MATLHLGDRQFDFVIDDDFDGWREELARAARQGGAWVSFRTQEDGPASVWVLVTPGAQIWIDNIDG